MSSRASTSRSQPHEAEWWKEAAQSFSHKITSSNNNYGSTAPLAYVTSPNNRYKGSADNDGKNNAMSSLQDDRCSTATNHQRGCFDEQDDIVGSADETLQSHGGALSDISNDSSDSESDDNYSSYESESSDDMDDHDLEQPHRTLGLIFFDFVRFVAFSANVRFFNTQMMPVLLAWKSMDILNKCLRAFMALSSVLLIAIEFPDFFPFLHHDPSNQTPPLYLSNWIPRGIFYLFLSLVMFEQQLVVEFIDDKRHASKSSRFFDGIFMVISASIMLLVGLLYILLGILCLQKVMERVRREEKERWDEYWQKLKKLEEEEDLEEERLWLLENGGEAGGGDSSVVLGLKERWRKWRKRFRRRYRRGRGWWRTIDFKC